MTNLLKADFKRVLKDRLFLVVCIIAGAFAFITPMLYVAIFSSFEGEMDEMLSMLGMSVSAKSMFFAAFALTDNLGLVLPILLSVILCKDFSHGTVRNKIIAGYSRRDIFLSMLTVCFTVLFGVLLAHAILTMLVSLIFFPFGEGSFGYFLLSVLFELLVCLFVASLISFLCASTKSTGLAVVFYVATTMIMSIVTAVLQIGGMILSPELGMSTGGGYKVVEFLQSINVFGFSSVIGAGTEYSAREVLSCILSPTVFAAALTALGTYNFGHKDLK